MTTTRRATSTPSGRVAQSVGAQPDLLGALLAAGVQHTRRLLTAGDAARRDGSPLPAARASTSRPPARLRAAPPSPEPGPLRAPGRARGRPSRAGAGPGGRSRRAASPCWRGADARARAVPQESPGPLEPEDRAMPRGRRRLALPPGSPSFHSSGTGPANALAGRRTHGRGRRIELSPRAA